MADTSSKIKGLLERNRKFAETWETPPSMHQMRAARSETGGATVVRAFSHCQILEIRLHSSQYHADQIHSSVTCLDPRCVPEQFFGPLVRVPVIRNAGGRATKDAVTSITVLRALARVSTVLVVHHTGKYLIPYLAARHTVN